MFELRGKRVFVAGHRGMVGQALVRQLAGEECTILTVDRQELDLRDNRAVAEWMRAYRPHAIFLAAARVGGILANQMFPVDFLLDNLLIQTSVIAAAHATDVERLLFLGSSCIYPKFAPQPIDEDALLTGPLEPTNAEYAIAKIAGVKLIQAYQTQYCRQYISAMPTNLYGPGDNYNPEASHVMPALIRKVHEARMTNSDVVVWGTGMPRRDFLYVDDCADACITLMTDYSGLSPVNVGSGTDMTILDLTKLVMEVVGYDGRIVHDRSKPDGTPRKLLDGSRLADLGWRPKVDLRAGIRRAYNAFLQGAYRDVSARST